MTLPQSSWADPGHHHHQAGQVRALVAGEAAHIHALVVGQVRAQVVGEAGHIHALVAGHIRALVVGQLRHVVAAQHLRH